MAEDQCFAQGKGPIGHSAEAKCGIFERDPALSDLREHDSSWAGEAQSALTGVIVVDCSIDRRPRPRRRAVGC